jgi:hypothetical protein
MKPLEVVETFSKPHCLQTRDAMVLQHGMAYENQEKTLPYIYSIDLHCLVACLLRLQAGGQVGDVRRVLE